MPKTKHSPVKILLDLGIDLDNLSSEEDYLSALMEGAAILQVGGKTDERFKILTDEVRKVRASRKEAAPSPGMQAKKKRITGADIKRTGAIGTAQRVAADTTGTSAIQKWQPPAPGVGQGLKSDGGLLAAVQSIDQSVGRIVQILRQSNKLEEDAIEDARKAAEKDKRKKRESALEKLTGPLGKVAEKVIAPFKSMWQKVWDFLSTILLGNIAVKLFDWFSNPKNLDKVTSIFRFIKDWWPVLVAGLIAFAAPLLGPVGVIAGIVALVTWAVIKIKDAIQSIFGFNKEVEDELGDLGKNSKKMGEDLTKSISTDLENDTDKMLKDEGAPGDKEVSEGKEVQQRGQKSKEEVEKSPDFPTFNQFAGGGQVPGSGNKDTVPAMLTPGEFVMSKGAVQRYGSGTLAGMNAAAGGTNIPKLGGYEGGGPVNSISLSVPSFNYPKSSFQPTYNFAGGGMVSEGYEPSPKQSAASVKKPKKDKSVLGNAGKTLLKFLTPFGMIPFVGKKIVSMGGQLVSGVQELIIDQHLQLHEREASTAQVAKSSPSLKPVQPPSRPSTTVAYDKEMQAQQQAAISQTSPGQDLPEFDATTMRSMSKIKTLGIVV